MPLCRCADALRGSAKMGTEMGTNHGSRLGTEGGEGNENINGFTGRGDRI